MFFQSAAEFHRWLEEHHATARELLVGFYRKELGRGIAYSEALDEALAFGWIDGIRKRVDGETYTIRFTPRKPRSVWSAINTRRVRQLISQGLMQPSGLRVFRERREQPTERRCESLAPALDAALRANRKASSFFDAQPPGYRRIMILWVMSAKREETRARRLALLIERSANGTRVDLLNPNRK